METGVLGSHRSDRAVRVAGYRHARVLVPLRRRRVARVPTFAIAISAVGYTTAMFFYDSFAFMQTLLMLSMLYAIAAWAMTAKSEAPALPTPSVLPATMPGPR